jgi:beta-N-acetylhexosaminidase
MTKCDSQPRPPVAARLFCIGFEGPQMTPELSDLLQRGVRSVILFTRNYESPARLAELCWRIKTSVDEPVLIGIDQEGGRVQRLRDPFTIIPSMRELGRHNDPGAVQRIGRVMARELRAVNIDMNLAPVLDVDSNPANPVIGDRSFGSDPQLVAHLGCTMVQALQSSGLAACGKHFPGHGDTTIDSHLDLPRLPHDLERLDQVELVPFRAAIDAGVAAIMCAHILFDAIDDQRPATMSRAIIHDLLRTQMRFNGVVCSDDLEMKAIADHYGVEQAVIEGANAGIDLFFICKDHELQHRAIDALELAITTRDVPSQRLDEANRRLDMMFDRYVRPASRWCERSTELVGNRA